MLTDAVSRLRLDLSRAGFTVDGLQSAWGADAAAALHRGHRAPALRALTGADPLTTLAKLFVLGVPVDCTALDAALPGLRSTGAAHLGLVEPVGAGRIRPLLDLRPYDFVDAAGVGSWWIVSDLGDLAVGGPLRDDHVLGVGGASTTLSGLMIQSPAARVLDLGTGCGIQAMHASRHAEQVVATDVSARALRIAELNAALNGIDNIEWRRGSLFDPVAGERFDQILSNPPFVITPRAGDVPRYEYRDGGMVGDELVATVVRRAADHLEPRGVAQLLGNWEYRPGFDGLERVRGWVAESQAPVDAWVVEREVQDPALYAETWIRDGGTRPGADFDRLTDAWLDDFAARAVTAIGFGYITLRASAARKPLSRLERLPGRLGHNPTGLGAHLRDCLDAQARIATLDDAGLLRHRLVVASDVTEERHYWPGDEHPTVMTLRQGGGFGREAPVGTALAAFVGACDGELTAGAIVDAIAQLLDSSSGALRAELLPEIRELVDVGILLLPDLASG